MNSLLGINSLVFVIGVVDIVSCSLGRVMEDKAFNGISQLEGQLMDSQVFEG